MPGIGDLFRRVSRRSPQEESAPGVGEPMPDAAPMETRPAAEPLSRAFEERDLTRQPPMEEPLWRTPTDTVRGNETDPLEYRADATPAPDPVDRLLPTTDVAVADPPLIESGDDVLYEDHLLVTCPYCGAENQRVGARCGNERCNQVIVRLPTWAQHRRRNWFTRRLSWRRIITACIIALLIVLVIWINYPFAPNPVVLFKQTNTQMTIDEAPGSWAAAGRDLRHSRQVEIGPPPPEGKITAWNDTVPGAPLESEPVSADTHIYIGSSNGIFALTHQDLSVVERWEGETPGRVTGAAAVVDQRLFFGSTDHTVNSWDAYDGQVRWSFPAEDTIEVAPVVSDGMVYVSSGESWVYGLDAYSGSLIWRTQLESNASDAVAVNDGRLYVGDEKGIFYILSARTGQEWFRYRTPRAITGSPVLSVDGQRAYFTSGGQLYAVDARQREIPGLYQFKQLWTQFWLWQVPGVPRPQGQQGGLWRFTPENPLQGVKSSPALAHDENGDVLYVGGHDHNLYALDAIDGSLLWKFEAVDAIWASPLIVKDQVIFGDDAGNLYSLHRATGTLNWTMNLGGAVRIAPVVSKGLLLVRTADGTVFGIR